MLREKSRLLFRVSRLFLSLLTSPLRYALIIIVIIMIIMKLRRKRNFSCELIETIR